MNWTDWYTDTMDVYRNVPVQDGALTRQERKQVLTGIPCRIYQSDNQPVNMEQTASHIKQADRLMCGPSVDIQAGDQLIIHRGAGVGKSVSDIRAFAADPNYYFEPFGAVIPGLAHQEVRLLQQERVKGGAASGNANATGTGETA